MDATDAALIRFFASPDSWRWDLRASLSEAARHVGVSRDLVRSRIQFWEERGILTGWDVMVHPGLLGRRLVRFETSVSDLAEKPRILEQLALLDGARLLFDYHGSDIAAVFYVAGPDEARLASLIESLTGAAPTTAVMDMPPPEIKPTTALWNLIATLRKDPRAPLATIAEELGTTTKTVHRRLLRLQQGRGAFLSARADFTRFDSGITVECRIGAEDPAAIRRELNGWKGIVFLNPAGPVVVCSFIVQTPMEVTKMQERLQMLPGVRFAACNIIQQRILVDAWLDAEVAKRSVA